MTPDPLTTLATQTAERWFGVIVGASTPADYDRDITTVDVAEVNALASVILEALQTALRSENANVNARLGSVPESTHGDLPRHATSTLDASLPEKE